MTDTQYFKRNMTPARRARLIERDGGQCVKCPNDKGPFIVDHIIPLFISGDDTDDNLQTLCVDCDKMKTANDMGDIAKTKRILGITKNGPKKKIPSRPFDTRYKKKINGNVILAG